LRSNTPSFGRLTQSASFPIQFPLAAQASRDGVALGCDDIPPNIASITICGGTIRTIVG
jgi:hypothetical protein